MLILGIDPGQNTGVATFTGGKLLKLHTIEPHHLPELIRLTGTKRVIFEDSRLQSHLFSGHKPGAGALSAPQKIKIARNVGQVDAWCGLIVAVCADLGIPAHGISPRGKGAKLNAAQFECLTGWAEKSNEHTRDAATVAWPYRAARA